MRAYVACTGSLFGILALLHLWRMLVEPQLASKPWYIGVTLVAAALALWAWRVLRLEAGARGLSRRP